MIREAIERAVRCLRTAGVEEPRQDAWLLLAHLRSQDRATLLAHGREAIDENELSTFLHLVDRRAAREPLAQIVGRKEFWSLDFRVTADVLCPRPDSECLIEAALNEVEWSVHRTKRNKQHKLAALTPDRADPAVPSQSHEPEARPGAIRDWAGRILDLGTGSGCLLLALLSELPLASGVGVDISTRALSVARSNSQRLGLAKRAHWLCSDWGASLDGHFDLIISNPPYVTEGEAENLAPEIRRFEPATALFAGEDGLDAYRRLRNDLSRLLAPGGAACLEIGAGQADSVEKLFAAVGFVSIRRRQDLAGTDRCLVVKRD